MPRPKAFDPETALDAAVEAFWELGYAETSAQTLTARSGLSRSSLYGTFESKPALFLSALARYRERGLDGLEGLEGAAPVRERIRAFLERTVPGAPGCDPRGCLVVNSALERAGRDPQVEAVVRADFARGREALRRVFAQAIADGEIAADRDPAALAALVQAAANGLRVLAAAKPTRTELDAVVDATLAAL